MSDLEISTDNKWKKFKCREEVPKKVQENQFDWLNEEEGYGFICYRKIWYHVSEFMIFHDKVHYLGEAPEEFKGWDGYRSGSFFSGVLIKINDCGDGYKIGTYYS